MIFLGTENHGNAMLRDGDLMFNESYYVYGFIDSSLTLMATVINDAICPYQGGKKTCEYPLVNIEELIYPIMFNLRHGAEVWLKWKMKQSVEMGLLSKVYGGHSIGKLYGKLKEAHEKKPGTIAFLESVEPFFTTLNDIDATGQVFRYDNNNKGTPHLAGEKCINVAFLHKKSIEFKGRIKEIDGFFDRSVNALRV